MNMRIAFLFILLHLSGFSQSEEYMKLLEKYYNDFPTISCSQAARLVDAENTYFLDTREKREFEVSHIKGAQCVGYDHFSMSSLKNVPKDAAVIVYCSIGVRSQNIGEKLRKAGYSNVRNLYGGFFQWSNSGLPKMNSSGTVTSKIHGFSREWGKWITKGSVVYK